MEILVALAIIGIIVAITAAALGGRATTTRLESVASQVSQTIQSRQQLFINDLRSAKLTMTEIAGELGTVFANSTIVDTTGTPNIVGANNSAACATPAHGIIIPIRSGALTDAEATNLQELIRSRVGDIFTNAPAAGNYVTILPVATGTTSIQHTSAAPTGAAAGQVNLCFGT